MPQAKRKPLPKSPPLPTLKLGPNSTAVLRTERRGRAPGPSRPLSCLNVRQTAALCGMGPQHLGAVLLGQATVSVESALRIAKVLDISVAQIAALYRPRRPKKLVKAKKAA